MLAWPVAALLGEGAGTSKLQAGRGGEQEEGLGAGLVQALWHSCCGGVILATHPGGTVPAWLMVDLMLRTSCILPWVRVEPSVGRQPLGGILLYPKPSCNPPWQTPWAPALSCNCNHGASGAAASVMRLHSWQSAWYC